MLASDEIRLFEILPPEISGESQAAVRGQTLVVPLTTNIRYEALSYVWGDDKEKVLINVDGLDTAITRNLERILRRIRRSGGKRAVWIDQICIDQDNIAEKDVQVPLMGQIYTNASSCLFWLGEIRSDIEISDALSAFEILRYLFAYGQGEMSTDLTPLPLIAGGNIVGPMNALRSIGLMENRWWHRIWTLQEAILARESYILWGSLSIPWDTIVGAARCLSHTPAPYREVLRPHFPSINRLTAQVSGIELAKQRDEGPLWIAYRWSFRGASDPRDKVYALLGLFPQGTLRRAERCKYDLPVPRLYSMFTVDLIEHHESLHPIALHHCEHAGHMTSGLPSWTFDVGFGVDFIVRIPSYVGEDDSIAWFLMHNYDWYDASAGSGITWKCFYYDDFKSELTLTGRLIDGITRIGDIVALDLPGPIDISTENVRKCCETWYRLAEEAYQTGDFADECRGPGLWPNSFWRGLIGNLIGPQQEPERQADLLDLDDVKAYVRLGRPAPICQQIFATISHRTMFVTRQGWLGFGPSKLSSGDQVWILDGGKTPFILRPLHTDLLENNRVSLVGPAYVDGMMFGEVFKDAVSSLVTLV